VLARGAGYVRDSIPALANVVATEEYVQRITMPGSTTIPPTPRRLKSEFLLVRYPGADVKFMAFRDVTEVDGRIVQQSPDRIMRLFAQPGRGRGRGADQQASAIAAESARYHLPGGSFAVTNPLVAVALMHPYYHPRLRFTLGGEERSLGKGVRAVRFQELEERDGQKLEPLFPPVGRTRGTVWIDPQNGRIMKTDIRFVNGAASSTSTTDFDFDARMGIMLPTEMRTTWRNGSSTVSGEAKYGQFRRFEVQTDTTVTSTGPGGK
jgi:hypothetical protein